MKSESGSFRFTTNSWIDSDVDWQDEASRGRGVTRKYFIYFFRVGLEIDGKDSIGDTIAVFHITSVHAINQCCTFTV